MTKISYLFNLYFLVAGPSTLTYRLPKTNQFNMHLTCFEGIKHLWTARKVPEEFQGYALNFLK